MSVITSHMKCEHLIWDSHPNFADWKEDMLTEYPNWSEDALYQEMMNINESYLEDERMNLDIQLSEPIIVIADLGLWNGRFSGYKIIPSGNIRDCLYSDTDAAKWYLDELGDLRCDACHHDGTNYYLYRVFKEDSSDIQRENLQEKIYNGTVTRADITRITKRLGDEIAKVYGFSIPYTKKEPLDLKLQKHHSTDISTDSHHDHDNPSMEIR